MEESLATLKIRFPTLPQNILRWIYRCRLERMRMLMRMGIPDDLRLIIEGKVRLGGEFLNPFVKHMAGTGRSSYSKKRRAKRMSVCFKCARWTCDTRCRNPGMVSKNREDKINFIKDGLSKESLDDIYETLETHPCGLVQRCLLDLSKRFDEDRKRYSLGNLTLNDPVCQFLRKLDGKQIPDS